MMQEEKIGGKDVQIRLKDTTCKMIIDKFNEVRLSKKHNDFIEKKIKELDEIFNNSFQYYDDCISKDVVSDDEYQNAKSEMNKLKMQEIFKLKNLLTDDVYMWAIYQLIEKKGIWPFRYPFRSFRHMRREIEKDEFINMGILINTHVIQTQGLLNSTESIMQ